MKNDGGTYRKDPEKKVSQLLKVYVTKQEKARLKKVASDLGLSLSSFARRVLIDKEIEIKPQELKRIRYELNKIGVNLNQLARKANENGRVPAVETLQAMHANIIQKLGEL